MVNHVVTGHGNGQGFPYVVATSKAQRAALVDTLLAGSAAVFGDADRHYGAYFYVGDVPSYDDDGQGSMVESWLRVGVHQGYGGAYFCKEDGRAGEDWAWVALAAGSASEAPKVYFDPDTETEFPPQAVMPLDQVRAIALEWAESGGRPRSVKWMPVNGLVWKLADDGKSVVPSTRKRSPAN